MQIAGLIQEVAKRIHRDFDVTMGAAEQIAREFVENIRRHQNPSNPDCPDEIYERLQGYRQMQGLPARI